MTDFLGFILMRLAAEKPPALLGETICFT